MQIANLFQSGGKEIRENSVSRETYASFNYRFTNTIEREDLNKIKKERKTRGIKRKIKERKKKGRKIENSGSHERLIFEGCISSIFHTRETTALSNFSFSCFSKAPLDIRGCIRGE